MSGYIKFFFTFLYFWDFFISIHYLDKTIGLCLHTQDLVAEFKVFLKSKNLLKLTIFNYKQYAFFQIWGLISLK